MSSSLFATQQIHAVIAASVSIKSSQKLKKILEVTYLFITEHDVINACFLCLKKKRYIFLFLLVRQIILALGNYMNSSKRGAVYGFKLQSLDLVNCQLLTLRPFTFSIEMFP